jgi:hypothetical protein
MNRLLQTKQQDLLKAKRADKRQQEQELPEEPEGTSEQQTGWTQSNGWMDSASRSNEWMDYQRRMTAMGITPTVEGYRQEGMQKARQQLGR